MYYNEIEQKKILKELDKELLAIVVVDMQTNAFELIYTDGQYKEYENQHRGEDFFASWRRIGLSLIYRDDRERMQREISRDFLLAQLENAPSFLTQCRFVVHGRPEYCRIKVIKNVIEENTLVIGIRNVNEEMQQELFRLKEKEEMRRRESAYKEKITQMRMTNFASQMQPHFVYNALSSIREIVLTDPQYAADLLYDFTVHLRASIRAMTNDDKIWLSQELDNIRAYVNIEKMRLGDRLHVEYDIGTPDFQIIPLSIQPLVENAIKHGLFEKNTPGGTVRVTAAETGTAWVLTVEDNGTGFDLQQTKRAIEEGKKDSTGLFNLVFRLEHMMQAQVQIDSRIGEGTKVVVSIPKFVSAS